MALESILFHKYTHQSDVWSYGMLDKNSSQTLDGIQHVEKCLRLHVPFVQV